MLYRYSTYRRCRYGCRTELSGVCGTGIDVVPNLSKCPVPVMTVCHSTYRTYRSVRYRYFRRYASVRTVPNTLLRYSESGIACIIAEETSAVDMNPTGTRFLTNSSTWYQVPCIFLYIWHSRVCNSTKRWCLQSSTETEKAVEYHPPPPPPHGTFVSENLNCTGKKHTQCLYQISDLDLGADTDH